MRALLPHCGKWQQERGSDPALLIGPDTSRENSVTPRSAAGGFARAARTARPFHRRPALALDPLAAAGRRRRRDNTGTEPAVGELLHADVAPVGRNGERGEDAPRKALVAAVLAQVARGRYRDIPQRCRLIPHSCTCHWFRHNRYNGPRRMRYTSRDYPNAEYSHLSRRIDRPRSRTGCRCTVCSRARLRRLRRRRRTRSRTRAPDI